jgi:transcriptional regulator with GAF, ATPase, and Fis domain
MTHLLDFLELSLGNKYLLLGITSCSFLLKIGIFAKLVLQPNISQTNKKPWYLLLLVLGSAAMSDVAWMIELTRQLIFPQIPYSAKLFVIRLAWAFTGILYQSLSIFIEDLTEQKTRFNLRQKLSMLITACFFMYIAGVAFFDINCLNSASRPPMEFEVRKIQAFFLSIFLIPTSLFLVFRKLRSNNSPRILATQARIITQVFIIPFWITDLIQVYPLVFEPTWITNSYAAVTISTVVLTYAIYYCSWRMMSLRFLNLKQHVEIPRQFNFVDGFKQVLESLSHATNEQSLRHITQTYFKEAFNVPLNKTMLFVRYVEKSEINDGHPFYVNTTATLVENFISTHGNNFETVLKNEGILIYDEIAFSNFYEKSEMSSLLLKFLETINADIFLPVYQKQRLVGYLVVDRSARPEQFYSNIERDEMLVFGSYLANIINLMQHRNLESLIHHEKELKEELYRKHQEVNQYKESIRSFLRNSPQKEIGILFYKNRRFIFGNKAAKDLIKININTQEGHALTKAARNIARQVEEYKSPQSCITYDTSGNKLVFSGVPNLEQNNIIITVYHPEISDILKKQIDHLKDPTQWDYLLYLETTKSGQVINQLIPGNGETLLNFKIELLKISLSKKAILLEMNEEDLLPTVEIIHHISLRETLHTLKLSGPCTTPEIAIKLFGINPLFGHSQEHKPILETLANNGTLFIQNIHFLDAESQEYLAELIRYGFYRRMKSEQRIPTTVRVICSTTQDLETLVREQKFSSSLFNELSRTALVMPSLVTLPEEELAQLADGLTEQVIKTGDLKNFLELTDKEKLKLMTSRPTSLHELKNKVQQLLIAKSKKNNIYNETEFDPAYEVSDPDLIEASRLGKQALKDRKVFTMLWRKFENQSKIATFLGVNRSSVNRRCKDYNLE